MKTISINGKNVNVSSVRSWKDDYEEHEEDIVEPGYGVNKIVGRKKIRETILKIELMGTGGKKVTLRGPEADAALEILRSSDEQSAQV